VSTRQRYRQHRFDPAPRRSAFGVADVVRAQLTWGDMQPILLRSAAVVGFAAAVAAFVSTDAFFTRPEPRPLLEAAVVIVQEEPEDTRNEPAAAELADLTGGQAADAAIVPDAQDSAQALASLPEPAPAADSTVAIPAPPAPPPPAALATPAAAPELPIAPPAVPAAAAVAPPALAAPAPEIPAASSPVRVAATEPGQAEPSPSAGESAAAPASVGSLAVADCPRDWVSVEGQPSARAGACEDMAALMINTGDPAEQRVLEEAALERATEIAALQFVPRIPQARPDPPARPRKTTTRKAGWPDADPPNCGKKRARWRYVNDVPTWYCR
jgi:hypothetical protein